MERPDFMQKGELARLIPVVADTSKEERAASVLLAGLRGVKAFREAMLGSLGLRLGKRAMVEAWTEVTFKEGRGSKGKGKRGKQDRPDGLIALNTSRSTWHALVETKIGNAEVDADQLESYVEQARRHGIDAVITVSNQFVAMPSHHPVKLPKTASKGVELFHWSWMYVLTQATLVLEEGVEAPDQEFLLSEIVRFFSHDSSGVKRFHSMSKEWKEVVGKVKTNATLSKTSEEVENTVSSWHEEQRDLALVMSRRLQRPVRQRLKTSHRRDPLKRLQDDCEGLVTNYELRGEFDIPNAAAPLEVVANLKTRTIVCGMRIGAPKDRKSTKARVNWLTRQLKDANPEGLHIEAIRPGRAQSTQVPLGDALEEPTTLDSPETTAVPTAFYVFYLLDLAGKFAGSKVFIERLEEAVPYFYEQAGQQLRAWVAPPPKMHPENPAIAASEDTDEEGNESGRSSTDEDSTE